MGYMDDFCNIFAVQHHQHAVELLLALFCANHIPLHPPRFRILATFLFFCPVPTMEMFTAHLFDPMTLLGFAMFGIFLYCVKDETRTLTTGESLAANWHLWNGE